MSMCKSLCESVLEDLGLKNTFHNANLQTYKELIIFYVNSGDNREPILKVHLLTENRNNDTYI